MNDADFRSLPSSALGAIEIALNRVLAGDPRALARCAELAGRSLTLRLADLEMALSFVAERHGVQVRGAPGAADVCLTGTLGAFGRLLFSGGGEGLAGSGLRIEGDIGIAQRFAELFAGLDFDPTDIIDARAGPVPAYFFERGFDNARALLARAARTLPEQAAEYLREETRDAVGCWEHERFVDDVETLRDDVARVAARTQRLDKGR